VCGVDGSNNSRKIRNSKKSVLHFLGIDKNDESVSMATQYICHPVTRTTDCRLVNAKQIPNCSQEVNQDFTLGWCKRAYNFFKAEEVITDWAG